MVTPEMMIAGTIIFQIKLYLQEDFHEKINQLD